ncbi:MAG: phosphomannose isomerase type II C-terminal cupin domain [Nostocoides sp.]
MIAHQDPTDGVFATVRPWGDFRQFTSGEPVTVKIISVLPGHRLSLQTHAKRSEYWFIVDGPLTVTVGDDKRSAQSGESVWVPVGATHRMANEGTDPARVLEIGFGDFDESDIVRLEDDYQR